MKKNNIYTLTIVIFCFGVAAIIFKYDRQLREEKNKDYALLERKGALANSDEWKLAKRLA
jgi:hypothetical protein